MDHIVVTGLAPYDGRYPFDLVAPNLTVREWGWLKRYADVYPASYLERAASADAELVAVLLAVALRRAGKLEIDAIPRLVDRLADLNLDDLLTVDAGVRDADEGDAGPPPGSSSSNGSSSGTGSTTSSETSTRIPPAGGAPDSDSSEFDLLRSGS